MAETKQYNVSKGPAFMPPKVKGLFLLGNTLGLLNPIGFLKNLQGLKKPVVIIKIGGKKHFVVQDASVMRYILQEHSKNFYKPGAAKLMKEFLGEGLATSNGDLWLRQRKLMQPVFHKTNINELSKIIDEETSVLIDHWNKPDWEVVDISRNFLQLTLSNITRSMFGTDIKKDMDHITYVVNRLLGYTSNRTASIIKMPRFVPTPSNLDYKKATREFGAIIYKIIERRTIDRKNTSLHGKERSPRTSA